MVEFSPVTARRRNMYVPEQNTAFVEAEEARRNAPPSAYEMMKRDTVKKVYDETLRATGNEDMALSRSRLVANRIGLGENIWMGIVAPEAAMAGAGRLVGAATQAFGRSGSTTSPALRNALTAEERLALPAPRSGPAIEMPPPRQPGPPARDVRSAPDELAAFEGEGGLTADAIAAHRQSVLNRIAAERAFKQRQLSTLEGEGGVTSDAVARARQIAQARMEGEAARRQGEVARFEGEGGPTADSVERARQIVRDRMAAEGARREMELARMTDEGGGMAMTRPMEQGVPPQRAGLPALRPEAVSGDVMPPTFTRVGESYYGPLATRPGSAMTGPIIEGRTAAQGYSQPSTWGAIPLAAAHLSYLSPASLAAIDYYKSNLLGQDISPANASSAPAAPTSGSKFSPEMFAQLNRANETPVREMDSTLFGEDVGRRPAPMRQMSPLNSSMSGQDVLGPTPPRRPTNLPGAREIPMPPRRPEGVGADTRAAESILSRIFSGKDYQTNARPVVEDRRVNFGDPESAADFFRAERAAREMGTLPSIERASGGQVSGGQVKSNKPPKDAALVKALEIIEHLMRR